ncbi:FAD-dependent pyridine nucleotide-disulfide oxidoreductase [Sulfolobus acidocaldarius SUSAZ]|nr:FAD-dependent pyridine nucleotide-disulfide oxidoreductase [Sulfolobus acidocaldarius SUSAZ]
MEYDVVVVGGGTAGYIAGSILARKGKKVLVTERERFGGVCVNYGCVPSIFFYDVTYFLNRGKEIGNYLGIEIETKESKRFFLRRDELISYLSDAGKRLIENAGGDTEIGETRILTNNRVKVNGKEIDFKRIIIASGTKPLRPKIQGKENAISEDEAVRLNYIPSSVVIIGGGFAGIELAQYFSRLNSNVTLLTRRKILRTFPEDAVNFLRQSLEFDGVKLIENTRVTNISKRIVETDKGNFEGEVVVYATGREPDLPKGIENIKVMTGENGVVTNERLRAGENAYAIGDVVDKANKTAHSAMLDAIICSMDILGIAHVNVKNIKIPRVLYTDPQIGVIGDINDAVKFGYFPFNASTRAIISGNREGYVKIGINEKNEIVFGEVIGEKAEELINILTLAVNSKMTVEQLSLIPFVHPSLSEAILNSAKSFFDLDVDRYKENNDFK